VFGCSASLILKLVEVLELLEIYLDAFFFFTWVYCTKGSLMFCESKGEYKLRYSANVPFGWDGLALCIFRFNAVAFNMSGFIINISQVLTLIPSYQPMGYHLIRETSVHVFMISIAKTIIIITIVYLINGVPRPPLTVNTIVISVSFLCRGHILYPWAMILFICLGISSPHWSLPRWSSRVSLRSLYKDSLEVIVIR
jgi:uncharacterized membrane protein